MSIAATETNLKAYRQRPGLVLLKLFVAIGNGYLCLTCLLLCVLCNGARGSQALVDVKKSKGCAKIL